MEDMVISSPIIHVITDKATKEQIQDMMSYYVLHIKVAVDLETGMLAGGGEWHADCEKALIERGCKQENIWGGGYIPEKDEVDFYSLINIRPKQGNPDQNILDQDIREKFEGIVRQRLQL